MWAKSREIERIEQEQSRNTIEHVVMSRRLSEKGWKLKMLETIRSGSTLQGQSPSLWITQSGVAW